MLCLTVSIIFSFVVNVDMLFLKIGLCVIFVNCINQFRWIYVKRYLIMENRLTSGTQTKETMATTGGIYNDFSWYSILHPGYYVGSCIANKYACEFTRT